VHQGLVFVPPQDELRRFMTRIVPRRAGRDLVMGSAHGTELHGGGVLGILVDYWRPEGRRAVLEDRYPFSSTRAPLALAEIYDSHRRQLYLPIPGKEPAQVAGAIPDAPRLSRMLFPQLQNGRSKTLQADAYSFLRILLLYEEDPAATWTNNLGQRLSADLVLGHAWDHYRSGRTAEEEFEDHSYLHLPEILLAYARRQPGQRDPNEVKRRFLSNELERTDYGGYEASEALGHYADSLGFLLAEPRIEWSSAEKRQVLEWLADLEAERFATLDDIPYQHLAHLLRGLRAVESHRARLR